MSGNQLRIGILNTEKHHRNLQRQRISTRKKGIKSFITRSYNQICLPVAGTLTKTTHDYLLGIECPKIRIKIFRCYVHLQTTLFKPFSQALIKVTVPRSLRGVRLYKKDIECTFRCRRLSKNSKEQNYKHTIIASIHIVKTCGVFNIMPTKIR